MTSTSVAESELNSDSTPARSAPARSRIETRRRLLAAGTELFAEHGLHPVTSARIARHAGVATGTFYLHFKDKKEMFREIVFAALARLRTRQNRAVEAVGSDPVAELRARTAELLVFTEENRNLVRILFGREREGAVLGEDVLEHLVPGIERRLRERQQAGEIPADLHPGLAAQALAAQTSRIIAWWVDHPDQAGRDEVLATLLRLHPFLAARPAAQIISD